MKIKLLFFFLAILIFSCTKEVQTPQEESTNSIDFEKPIFIQVEAVHENGKVVKSPIFVVKY